MDTDNNVYQTPQSELHIEGSEEYTPAGFWVRVVAAFVDTLLMMLVIYPLLLAIYGVEFFTRGGFIQGVWDLLLSYIFPAIAIILFWLYRAATPGKTMLSLKVIRADDGGPITVPQAIGRYLAYYVSTIPLMLGFLWVGL